MMQDIVAAVIAAALIGTAVMARRWWKREAPLALTGQVDVPKAWELALPSVENLPSSVPADKRTYMPLYWLLRHQGAADFEATTVKLLVENRSEQPLTITDITVRKVSEDEPFSAAWVRYPPAGAAEALVLDFRLDDDAPAAWSATYDSLAARLTRTGERPYFDDHVIMLTPGESQALRITGRAENIRCSWRLEVETIQSGKRVVTEVRPEGGVFHTSGAPPNGFESRWEWSWYRNTEACFEPPPYDA
ncbi:hypothetical protein [Streptomyces iranensis]|uniref:hypothetical protein n=1 Tax=Streptomyces iranensis TaxID=576784 RepID=UPI0039B74C11